MLNVGERDIPVQESVGPLGATAESWADVRRRAEVAFSPRRGGEVAVHVKGELPRALCNAVKGFARRRDEDVNPLPKSNGALGSAG